MNPTLIAFLAVAVGGFLGGLARWGLNRIPGPHTGTWASNVVGSSVLGFTIGLPGVWPLLFATGFAGALSTFSTLAAELGALVRQRRWGEAARYAASTAVISLVAAFFGLRYAARAFGG